MSDREENPWDKEAETFDEAPDHGLRDPVVRSRWIELIDRLAPGDGTALDIGCGTGTLSVLLSQRGLSVTGIDSSTRMIASAKCKASEAGAAIEFRVDDAASPALAPETFDLVLGRHILWALPDLGVALMNWTRLLRPGGRLILIEGFWHTGAGLHREQIERALPATAIKIHTEDLGRDPLLWGGSVADERYALVVERR